jgi:hypothetical protein
MNATYPLSFLARQLAGPAFTTMINNLGFPQNLALELFHRTSQLVAKALDERPTDQMMQTAGGTLELTGPVG